MRTVFLVTRHPDVARLGPELERAGFSAPVIAPERLANDDVTPSADVVVLDLRDIPAAAFSILSENYAENGVILIVVAAPEQMDRVTVDLPVDDFVSLSAPPAELARRIERALWRKHGVDSENFVHCGALTLDLSNYRVTVDSEPLVMTFKEYELWRFLAMTCGRGWSCRARCGGPASAAPASSPSARCWAWPRTWTASPRRCSIRPGWRKRAAPC